MAVRVDDFGKTGRVETNSTNPAQSTRSLSGKEAGHSNVFQALLKMLKSDESARPAGSLRNKPASTEVIRHDHHGVLRDPGAIRGFVLHSQNVNNLAASVLIAMAAVSSGPNRIDGLCSQGAGMPPALPGWTSGAAGVCSSAPDVRTGLCKGQQIGDLSARFESGERGPGVIGYDDKGGTSYGTYQISSKAGTMNLFIDYLSDRAPDLADKLKAAGPANTGSRSGRMPEVWKEITAADPARFEKLQFDFIEKSHYLPALQEISDKTGLDISKAPRALQEVLWSTAVQHGAKGAAKIFTRAIKRVEGKNNEVGMAQLIDTVYDMRADQFASSGPGVRAAVRNRFREEGRIALAMLSNPLLNSGNISA